MSATLAGSRGSMTVELGPTPPALSDGVGGWEVVARPRRMGMTEWRGPAPRKATLQVLFDGYATGRSVEADVAALGDRFAPALDEQEPPQFTVTGAWPIPSTVQWVCEDITIDDFLRDASGAGVRALVSMTLLQYVPGDVVLKPGTAAARAQATAAAGSSSRATSAKARTYTVKAGDTLSAIAAAQLGNYRRFTELASLNGLRDPNRLTVGQKLRLP